MPTWENERKKVWGLMLDLKAQVKTLKQELEELKTKEEIKHPEQPAQRAGA